MASRGHRQSQSPAINRQSAIENVTMENLIQDIRYSLRMLTRKPGFTLLVVAALAIGIGANSAIFSIVNSILLRPLPYRDPDRLVMVWMDNHRLNVAQDVHSYANYADYRDQNQSFDQLAVFNGISVNLTGAGEPERVIGTMASPSLFEVMGVDPLIGRTFSADEEVPGHDQVVILGYGFWQRRFGGDRNILGQEVSLSDVKRTVIGVMPQTFEFPHKDAELWVPLAPDPRRKASRGGFSYQVVGRLKPGVSLPQARQDMNGIAQHLVEQYPDLMGYGVNLVALHDQIVGKVRPALLVLLATVAFVLLIACANVANLLLARAASREREIAIRSALGAGRLRVVRQLLTESLVIAVLGGVTGLLIANWGLKALVALSPEDIPRRGQIGIDLRVLGFTLLLSILTGIVFGLVPALRASKMELNESLKEGGRGASGGIQGRRIRSALVVLEVALSLLLLIGAGLMIRSFRQLLTVDLGFNPDRLLTMNIQLSRSRYQGPLSAAFFRQLIERVEALPGVESAGAITAVFIEGLPNSSNFTIDGRPPPPAAEQIEAPIDFVTPGYFRTMGISLLKGRELSERDGPEAPQVAIINDTFARRFWPGEDPLGQRFRFGDSTSTAPWLTIVGVVADMRRTGFDSDVRCEAFLPYAQRQFVGFLSLVVRTAASPGSLAATVRDIVWSMDPEQPVSHIRTMDQMLGGMMAQRRLNMVLFSLFAGVALVLAAVGIYGVISYSVTQRTHEIGIRMALGAGRAEVLKLVVGEGMTVVGIGIGLGLVSALGLTRLMATLLYGVSPTDPLTFAALPLVLAGVALAACLVPGRRATKVDPIVALRYE
jgi:putative ABC transport system permease protein